MVVPYAAQGLRIRTALLQRQLRVTVGLPSQILGLFESLYFRWLLSPTVPFLTQTRRPAHTVFDL